MARLTDARSLAAAVGELGEHSPADFPTTIERVCAVVAELVDASDVLLCFGVLSPGAGAADGWRPLGTYRWGPNADRDALILDQWYRAPRNMTADPAVTALVRTHGHARALLRSEIADEAKWRQSRVDALLDESGIRDRLVSGAPLAPDAQLLLAAYRRHGAAEFGREEREGMADLVSRLRHVGRTMARAHGLIDAVAPLTKREREALHLLLLGLREADAARRLGLTTRSFHQYAVELYRKLGVRSRGELAAHFVSADNREALLARYAHRLAPRELEVLRGLVSGLSEKEIADDVQLSARAVHHVLGAVYRKMAVHSRAALLAKVLAAAADGRVSEPGMVNLHSKEDEGGSAPG